MHIIIPDINQLIKEQENQEFYFKLISIIMNFILILSINTTKNHIGLFTIATILNGIICIKLTCERFLNILFFICPILLEMITSFFNIMLPSKEIITIIILSVIIKLIKDILTLNLNTDIYEEKRVRKKIYGF